MAENLNASENKVGFDPSQMFLEEIQQEDQLRRLEAAKKVRIRTVYKQLNKTLECLVHRSVCTSIHISVCQLVGLSK